MLRFPEWVIEAFLRMLYVVHKSFSDDLTAFCDGGKGCRICPRNKALQQDRLPDIHDGQNNGAVLVGLCTFCMVGRGAVI